MHLLSKLDFEMVMKDSPDSLVWEIICVSTVDYTTWLWNLSWLLLYATSNPRNVAISGISEFGVINVSVGQIMSVLSTFYLTLD